jgi:hypothetical protein
MLVDIKCRYGYKKFNDICRINPINTENRAKTSGNLAVVTGESDHSKCAGNER